MPHRIFSAAGVYFMESPIHASKWVLLLAMQALLVTLIELLFNYKHSADRGGLGLVGSQGKQASQSG
jgi:hypothetical protein